MVWEVKKVIAMEDMGNIVEFDIDMAMGAGRDELVALAREWVAGRLLNTHSARFKGEQKDRCLCDVVL